MIELKASSDLVKIEFTRDGNTVRMQILEQPAATRSPKAREINRDYDGYFAWIDKEQKVMFSSINSPQLTVREETQLGGKTVVVFLRGDSTTSPDRGSYSFRNEREASEVVKRLEVALKNFNEYLVEMGVDAK